MSGWVFHAPFLHALPGFELYAVWERTKELARAKYPSIKTFRSYDELLADPALELVVVNTPNHTHFEYAEKALAAGKHVIVEKPFTVTVDQAAKLIDLAARLNLKLSVYQNRRYDSDYKTIARVMKEGLLGKIVEAEFHFDRYKLELSPKQHKETGDRGTGSLYDLGSHLIDQALQLFGMPDSIFADILAMRPGSKVDDYFELLLYYPSHRVRIKSSYQVREPLPGYVLHGSKGSFIKPKTDVQETMLQSGAVPGGPEWGKEPDSERGLLHAEKDGKIIREYLPSLQGNYGQYYEGIYMAIRNNADVPVSATDGLKVIRMIEAAFKSNSERRVIDIEVAD